MSLLDLALSLCVAPCPPLPLAVFPCRQLSIVVAFVVPAAA